MLLDRRAASDDLARLGIFYGDNLLDYVAHEFKAPPLHPAGPDGPRHISFWSNLADGGEGAGL